MKKRGMILIEITIGITLFFFILYPLVKFTQEVVRVNNKISDIQREFKNFSALKKQLSVKDYRTLQSYMGNNRYTPFREPVEDDGLVGDIFFPYPFSDIEFSIDISDVYIFSKAKKYDYLCLKVMYMVKNKTFTSEIFVEKKDI